MLRNSESNQAQANTSENNSTSKINYFKIGAGGTVLYALGAGLCIGLISASPWVLAGLAVPVSMMAYDQYQKIKERRALENALTMLDDAFIFENDDENQVQTRTPSISIVLEHTIAVDMTAPMSGPGLFQVQAENKMQSDVSVIPVQKL